ncbi:MAG: tRNA lysidine(34) synthetase TilS [Sulfobacillus sp.]
MDWMVTLRQRLQAAFADRTQPVAVVAVSGGADSMALLEAMAQIAPQIGLALHIACLDHGWRQSRAPQLVAARTQLLGLPLSVGHLPPRWAATEERARLERRRFLAHVAAVVDAQAVILAHHGSDQAETVLAHLIQGTTSHGIRGMRQWSEGLWLRPLIDVPGGELRRWADAAHIPYEEDPTNADQGRLRNWIRLELLPAMAKRQPQIEQILGRTARLAAWEDDALGEQAERSLASVRPVCGGLVLDLPQGLPGAVVSRIAYALLVRLNRRPTEGQVTALGRALATGGGGGRGLWVGKMGTSVWLGPSGVLPGLPLQAAPGPGQTICLPEPLPPGLADMQLAAIATPMWVRGWQPGDRLTSGGGLADVWDGAGVPMPLRTRVPLIVTEHGVAAVLGVRGPWQGKGELEFSAERATLTDRRPSLVGLGAAASDCGNLKKPAPKHRVARHRPVRKGASARS